MIDNDTNFILSVFIAEALTAELLVSLQKLKVTKS